MRVTHLITGLGTGGAETMLVRLLERMDRARFEPSVVALRSGGRLAERVAALDVPLEELGLSKRRPSPAGLLRLLTTGRRFRPQLVQGWMYHGNLASLLVARAAPGRPPVLWNVRHSLHDLAYETALNRVIIRAGARLSHRTRRIVYNAERSAEQHERLGFCAERRVVIANGVDPSRFAPAEAELRASVRRRWGYGPEQIVIGHLARLHPMKGHQVFLRAAGQTAAQCADLSFVMAGTDVVDSTPALRPALTAAPLGGRLQLLGELEDVRDFLAGIDLLTMASQWGEGFPNVVLEAMACGVPCVVTDVGDAARVVGDTGWVVPASSPRAIADAWLSYRGQSAAARRERGASARARVERHFTLDAVARRYEALYLESAARAERRAAVRS